MFLIISELPNCVMIVLVIVDLRSQLIRVVSKYLLGRSQALITSINVFV